MTARPSDAEQPRLENLLDLNDPVADWSAADLAAMLRHQLAHPLEPGQPPLRELLERPVLSVESLETVKRHAKVRRGQQQASVQQELWRVIYYAAIAAARRSGQHISDLSPAELTQGFAWTLSRPWLGPSIRQIVEQAQHAVQEPIVHGDKPHE